MSVRNIGSDNKKSYRERRRGGKDRNAAFSHEDKKPKSGLHDKDGELNAEGLAGDKQAVKTPIDKKTPHSHNLKQEKGADLQQEQGAELAAKNRLKEKPGEGLNSGNLPTYGNYIKDQKKYRKHAAKVKEYAQPYKSTFEDSGDKPEDKPQKPTVEENTADSSDTGSTLYTPDLPIKPIEKQNGKPQPGKLTEKPETKLTEKPKTRLTEKSSKPGRGESQQNLKNTPQSPKLQAEPTKKLIDEGSRWSKIKEDSRIVDGGDVLGVGDVAGVDSAVERVSDKQTEGSVKKSAKLKNAPKGHKLQADKSKLSENPIGRLETGSKNKLTAAPAVSPNKLKDIPASENHNGSDNTTGIDNPDTEKPTLSDNQATQKDINRKKQYSAEYGQKPGERYINTDKSPGLVEKQHKLHDKVDKLMEKGSKLQVKQAENIAAMPTETKKHSEYTYDEKTGRIKKTNIPETHTLHQNEAHWNNPKFSQKLRKAKGVKGKAAVVGKEVAKKGAILGSAGAAGAVAGVGAVPVVTAAVVAKPTLKYGSKLMQNEIHRQVRQDIRQSNNEVLQAAHWAEQKGERAVVQGVRKLNPVAVRRYVKNAPYRRESKLKLKELKNDKKLGLLRVKQDKASGVNHMTGKKSNPVARAWQKRQIKRNYQKAISAAKGKVGIGGSIGSMAREVARGNPKAIAIILAKKIALVMAKFVAKITVFNPLFWKAMAIVLLFVLILISVQACVAMFTPGMAGFGIVSDEDISHSTRLYSEWEVDMQLYLDSVNIAEEFPPPANITSQPGVNGVVVYPEYPYTPPPPFYEYRFEIGMISHDPMELISYLTARHGERFDEDSANPMTRSNLEAILAEIFEAQYGIAPGDFDNLIHEEVETRFRRERRWEQTGTQSVIVGTDENGLPIWDTKPVYGYVYHDVYYQFWILTVSLQPRSLSEVLRSRMTIDEQAHFDILVLTGNGRQIVGNPFNFNWLPNITSHYGYRINPTGSGKQLHMGIDIAAPLGTPIFATHTGTITQVQFSDTGYGNMIRLYGEGADGEMVVTLFAHLHEIHVTEGQEVTQGDLIGTVGSSGDSTGPHLHLEVIRQNPTMHLNPIFAVITWTDEEGNEHFRPLPGEGGVTQFRPPHIPEIPPEAMSDERFVAILTEAGRHLGARYVWGGAGPTTFDCSGFIHWVFSNAGIGWTHGRTTAQGYFNMSTPVSQENARPGDLVFFTGTHSGAFITHVGIYIGNGQMIHTGGNPAGVEFVSINTPFWQRHFYAFGRV